MIIQYDNDYVMKIFNNSEFLESVHKLSSFVFLMVIFLFLNACSSAYGPVNPQTSRALPTIPEISHSKPVVRKPVMKVTSTKRQVKNVYKPKVKKYSVDKAAEPVITQAEVATVLSKEERVKIAQKAATVEFDPYAVVPDSRSSKVVSTTAIKKPPISTAKASPAVTSLMLQARGELAIGNTKSAVSKLERALRIESQNPKLWNLLAQANYDQSSFQQAISMAKKSIRYSRNEDLISKNWKLIQKAGESSGDTVVIKEALNYFKVNP